MQGPWLQSVAAFRGEEPQVGAVQGSPVGLGGMVSAVLANKVLAGAFAVSIGVHAAVLAVRFVDPEFLRVRASDPTLEIILVNARSEVRPSQPQALAQANLDGGGTHEEGRRTSPLPESLQVRDGDTLESARKMVEQLELEQKRLLSSLTGGDVPLPVPSRETQNAKPAPGSAEEAREKLARVQAEIARQVSDYQKRPRKHHFMPSTSEYRYARYVEDWRARVEKIGNEHYPEEARGKVYGTLRMTVSIRKDGTLVDAIIENPSGSPVLDRAARRIIKLAAPFPPFPPEIARDTDILEITRTWMFTNDQFATRQNPGQGAANAAGK
jgi:protein TonB